MIPKKRLGQHFLRDTEIAQKIANSLSVTDTNLLELGPGTGALTTWLEKKYSNYLTLVEKDQDLIPFLKKKYPRLKSKIIQADFLDFDLSEYSATPFYLIGNFPYNISSQIFFKIIDYKYLVKEVVCMIQKEVADRLAGNPGTKTYGLLSVFLQTYYDIEYLFTVPPSAFSPPPKVQSAVIRLKRNKRLKLPCDELLFKKIVKAAFGQRRKMLRNALKNIAVTEEIPYLKQRAEELTVEDFIKLTHSLEKK